MAKNPFYESFYLNPDEDEDIREFLKQCKAMGYSKSYIIKKAIRHFMGKFNELQQENIDSANLRYIQLEKRLAELEKRDEERYQEILELIQKKFEESRKEREELRKELELIKKAQESLRAKAEEEKRRREEEERERKKEIYREAVREQVIRYYDGFVEKRINDPKYRKDWVESAITRMQWFHLNDEPVDYDLLLEVLREECPELVKHFEVVLNV